MMSTEDTPLAVPAEQTKALRDSIVQRLKAHDATVRSAHSKDDPQKTTRPEDQ